MTKFPIWSDPRTWPDRPSCSKCGKQFGWGEGWLVNQETMEMYHADDCRPPIYYNAMFFDDEPLAQDICDAVVQDMERACGEVAVRLFSSPPTKEDRR